MMNSGTSGENWSLILSGGDGRRLQGLTRALTGSPLPKQYCRIVGDRSLLETTLARTQHYAPLQRTLVTVNRDHLELAGAQLRAVPSENILVQPRNRDTGPGVLFSLLCLTRRSPQATVAVFPSDHYVGDDRAFVTYVQRAAHVVALVPDKLVLLGIRPDRFEDGYGYVEPGQPLAGAAAAAFHVARFSEKPSAEAGRLLLARGGLWNSFVMVFRLATMLALLRRQLPGEFDRMSGLPGDPEAATRHYQEIRPWNFSADFLSRIPEHLIVLRVDDVHWSDWGTAEAIERTLLLLKQRVPWRKAVPAAA